MKWSERNLTVLFSFGYRFDFFWRIFFKLPTCCTISSFFYKKKGSTWLGVLLAFSFLLRCLLNLSYICTSHLFFKYL